MTHYNTNASGSNPLDDSQQLVQNLADVLAATPECAQKPTILETHLSWVILAGDSAWKLKKPVDFDFVDFSSLERRRLACEQELKLNCRYSPSLYLGVVPVCGTQSAPYLALSQTQTAGCSPLEYAVHMKRFSQQAIFSTMIAGGRLDEESIDALADLIGTLHESAVVDHHRTPESGTDHRDPIPADAGSPATVRRQILQVLDGVASEFNEDHLESIRARLLTSLSELANPLEERRQLGFIRRCHADLHLSNICLYEGEVAVFDCLEFDPLLRIIDVMADLAFVIADLLAWGRDDLASRFLNRYLTFTGDYAGLRVLPLYVAYRALVRARVGLLSGGSIESDESAAASGSRYPAVTDYIRIADKVLDPDPPRLIILHGLSGCGKSWLSEQLSAHCQLVRIRSDVERKRLLGLGAFGSTQSVAPDAYATAHSQATYTHLARLATQVIQAGYSAIVDATFLRQADRQLFARLAHTLGTAFLIVDVQADEQVLRYRLRQRLRTGNDPSEANEAVLQAQLASQESLSADEQKSTISFDNTRQQEKQDAGQALGPVIRRITNLIAAQ